MLNLSCVICVEIFTPADDVHVTTCGHMFHYGCLLQWLERSKTCPQCRKKCTERNIIRIYFNLDNQDFSHIDIGTLQEQLDIANLQVKIKEKDNKKAAKDVKNLKAKQRNFKKTIADLEEKLKKNEFTILRYSEQVQMLKSDVKMVEEENTEIRNLLKKSEFTILRYSEQVQMLKSDAKWVEEEKTDLRNLLNYAQRQRREEIEEKDNQLFDMAIAYHDVSEKLEVLKRISASANKPNQETNASSGFTNNFLASVRDMRRRATISPTIVNIIMLFFFKEF